MSTDIKRIFKDMAMSMDKEQLADSVASMIDIYLASIGVARLPPCFDKQEIPPAFLGNLQTARQNTIECDKKQALIFYEHLLDLVEKEKMSKNYSEWCELEREYIAMISEKHFTEHFKNYGNNEKENNFQRQAQGHGRVDIR